MTKDELIEKYRDINVEDDWWEWVYADFTCDMSKVGVSVDKLWFDGFYHQGSHAEIECSMRSSVENFMASHNLSKNYPAIYKLAVQGGVHIRKKNSLEVEIESWEHFDACEDEDMNEFYKVQYQEEVDVTYKEFEEDVEKILEDYEDDLYRRLRDEYEGLVSDEIVWETIVGNELDDEWDENINRGLKIGGCYA
jgi:hypothetical protein